MEGGEPGGAEVGRGVGGDDDGEGGGTGQGHRGHASQQNDEARPLLLISALASLFSIF